MADFLTSTHRAKWIFSPQDLKEKYKAANQRARQALEKYGATRMEVDVDGSWSYPEPQPDAKEIVEKHSRKPLKIEEEQLLRTFYEFKIQDPARLKKIMYQRKSLSLGFDLIVYAPYRPLEGFVSVMEEFIEANDEQLQMLQDMHETAKVESDKIMLTDASLLFPPGQLALAALYRANEVHGLLDFERCLGSLLSRQHDTHSISELTVSLNTICSLVSKLVTLTATDMKHVDRKLKLCRDPSSHDKSKKRKHRSKESSNEFHA